MEFPSHERDLPPIVMFNSSLRDLSSFANIYTYTWTCHAIPFEDIRNKLHFTSIFHLLCNSLANLSFYEKILQYRSNKSQWDIISMVSNICQFLARCDIARIISSWDHLWKQKVIRDIPLATNPFCLFNKN